MCFASWLLLLSNECETPPRNPQGVFARKEQTTTCSFSSTIIRFHACLIQHQFSRQIKNESVFDFMCLYLRDTFLYLRVKF